MTAGAEKDETWGGRSVNVQACFRGKISGEQQERSQRRCLLLSPAHQHCGLKTDLFLQEALFKSAILYEAILLDGCV